jgi:glycosyltransferase involved in cell wall biosynthesis
MKISIITTSYNSVDTIHDTIKSVIAQKYENIEYLVIDGGSTDGTVQVLNEYSKSIFKIVSETDNGIYDAMNKGINLATGEIIGFLNSDDFYVNEKVIEKVAEVFKKNPSLDSCYSDLVYVDKKNNSKILRYWKSSKFKPGLFSLGWCPPHPTFFVKRSLYLSKGIFNLNYGYVCDVELMMRYLEIYKISSLYIPEIWIKMRIGGVTNKKFKNIIMNNQLIFQALNKNNLSYNKFKFILNKILSRFLQYIRKKN